MQDTGTCTVCGRVLRLTKRGKVATHAPAHGGTGYGSGARMSGFRRLNHCKGSGQPPEVRPPVGVSRGDGNT